MTLDDIEAMTPTTAEVVLCAVLGIPLALGLLWALFVAALAAYDDYRKDYKRNRLHPERYNGWNY